MKFSTFAGTALIPTLARVILCGAFITAGWNKCFKNADFTPTQAQRLQELGVRVWKVIPETTVRAGSTPDLHLVSFRQDEDSAQNEPETEAQPPAEEPPAKAADPAPPATTPPPLPAGDDDVFRARSVHGVTLAVDGAGWPYPVVLGWVAGLTELFGGALLVVGLFSRVWGLGLAIAMGVAFYLTSVDPLMSGQVFQLASGEGIPAFNRMFCQLGLLLASLCILLVGPGPISLDHRIFRKSGRSTIEYDTGSESEQSTLRPF
jgi:uncharacterized membrane protein YphA (DoxX/SURF4 family)